VCICCPYSAFYSLSFHLIPFKSKLYIIYRPPSFFEHLLHGPQCNSISLTGSNTHPGLLLDSSSSTTIPIKSYYSLCLQSLLILPQACITIIISRFTSKDLLWQELYYLLGSWMAPCGKFSFRCSVTDKGTGGERNLGERIQEKAGRCGARIIREVKEMPTDEQCDRMDLVGTMTKMRPKW
jgi:hypothetical protein